MITTITSKKKNTDAPVRATDTVPVVANDTAPTIENCELKDKALHTVVAAGTSLTVALIVGNVIFSKRKNGWLVPALVGGISGQVVGVFAAAAMNHFRKTTC